MSKIESIKKGSSLPFSYLREGLPITGWTAKIILKQYPQDAAIVDRVITPVDGEWPDLLTSAETAGLNVGLHYLTGILENTATLEKEQIPLRFHVGVSWE
jgi:hypothetical protein